MFYATVMVCWISLGCLLATSPDNPYEGVNACKTETARMGENLSTPPWLSYGPPDEVLSKCLSEEEYLHLTEVVE